jgi:hypothetical protein
MIRHARTRWAKGLGTAAVLALAAGAAAAQEPLTWSRNVAGDSAPITLYADSITTWRDQGRRIFLLKGRVLVEHGIVSIHLPQGVAWLDEAQKARTGVYHLELVVDGEIRVQEGSETCTGLKGHVDLTTRGELRIKAYRDKVVQEPLPADAVYLRGVAMKYRLAAQANTPPPPQGPAPIQPMAVVSPSFPSAAPAAAAAPARPGYLPTPASLPAPGPLTPTRPPAFGPQVITLLPGLSPTGGTTAAPRASLGFPQ